MFIFCIAMAIAHDPLADPFRQLEEELPTPNRLRTAAGRPGVDYWQQRADYDIKVKLDDQKNTITGSESILYHNNSPEPLPYLWVQLDQNYLKEGSDRELIWTAPHMAGFSFNQLNSLVYRHDYDGEIKITSVKNATGETLPHSIIKTMMRIDLASPIQPGESYEFSIDWNYAINNAKSLWARTGYEYFEEDKNSIYEIAQWFPRMAAYTDVHGWHHKQYLGRGEFTLEFGDYNVEITVPDDHIVAATGLLQNPKEALSTLQLKRYNQAKTAERPVFIVTPEEALKAQKNTKAKKNKTWRFAAKNVRDFAFATSRKFIWDAWGRPIDGKQVMAMSFYPNEAEPLWSKYSTHAIAHTLDVYSKMVSPYPYPVSISVNGPVYGMEYPMITFNGPRPTKDKDYHGKSRGSIPWIHNKYGLISVIIHEIGHNWFPMIINSDERSWTWLDEGLNSFVQYHAELSFEPNYPNKRGDPDAITRYMTSANQVPIMTNSESLKQFGSNSYAKPAAALSVLRESILGPETFDFALKEYAKAWEFKRPMPADFFRIMEDASGQDLDWFWRGWFYTTSHVDIELSGFRKVMRFSKDPKIDQAAKMADRDKTPLSPAKVRAKKGKKYIDNFPELNDFYTDYDPLAPTEADVEAYEKIMKDLSDRDKGLLKDKRHYAIVELKNVGGLPSPVILEVTFKDGSRKDIRYPAEIWSKSDRVSKLITSDKEISVVLIDPHREMADANPENNRFPPLPKEQRFDLQPKKAPSKSPMRQLEDRQKKKQENEKMPEEK